MHFQVKMTENVTKKTIRGKPTTNKVPPLFLDAKMFPKKYNSVFGICQITSKVQCIHLTFKNFNINSKNSDQWSEI